ncbi:MAG: glycogen debranching enzyme family protein [Desulfuromonadales bacterium]|nr:glycogen debranching enzyme family protein [Desulfuromonadales bacterium]
MTDLHRRIVRGAPLESDSESWLHREWLVANGLGGFASASISGAITRRYHGLLVAALPAPFGRMVMLNHLSEHLVFPDGTMARLGLEEQPEQEIPRTALHYLTEFRLERGLPVWRFEVEGVVVEKRLLMAYQQNTVYLSYHFLSGPWPVRLELRPYIHFRHQETRVDEPIPEPYALSIIGDRYEISSSADLPKLKLRLYGERSAFTFSGFGARQFCYRQEAERGYEACGTLWNPGSFTTDLLPGRDTTLVASTESWRTIHALRPEEVLTAERLRRQRLLEMAGNPSGVTAELVLAADQFLITPAGRIEEAARAHASGDQVGTVIAGYHWFTDWGRDTMISLEGLTLVTGRHREAGWVLRTFAHYVRDGLIPNMFPEGKSEGLYHTADATLWFFHAIDRYLEVTGDRSTLRLILPTLQEIIYRHRHGTRFGIQADRHDALLQQGAPGYQLTWMDAKVGDWVVTPRRGKAVEINALWYNALRLLEGWLREEEETAAADDLGALAVRVQESFNRRFWYAQGNYLYDVVDGEDGDDAACRPNQIFSLSLRHPVLDPARWQAVLSEVHQQLLTPVGLRSLAPGHPDYKAKYFGDIHARDAAYHQGTVWGWLIGPFVDAWLRVHPEDRATARTFLTSLFPHLEEACIGSISEVFDAEPPFTPRGCVAQAWSVAEVLRCLAKTG